MITFFRCVIFIFRMMIFLSFNFFSIRKFIKNPEKNSVKNMKKLFKIQYILQRYCKVKINRIGEENIDITKTYLIVVNHRSVIDPFLLTDCIKKPFAAVIAGELYFQKIPIFGKWFSAMRCVYIDRENPKRAVEGINQAIENLKDDISMLIFPEGDITSQISKEVVGEFKRGAFRMAQKSKTPILPIVLLGTDKIYSKYGMTGLVKKGEVKRIVLKPYEKHINTNMTTVEISEEVRNIFINTIKENMEKED